MVWNALSLKLGRDAFRRIVSGIAVRYATSRITWDDFLKEVSRGANRDLSWFYAQWFDRPGAPEWRVTTLGTGAPAPSVVLQESPPCSSVPRRATAIASSIQLRSPRREFRWRPPTQW